MIYHVSWSSVPAAEVIVSQWSAQLYPGKTIGDVIPSPRDTFAEFVKSSKDDSFIFILGSGGLYAGLNTFDKWLEKHGMKDYEVVRSEGITNPVHHDRHFNLRVIVLQSKEHFARIKKEIPQ